MPNREKLKDMLDNLVDGKPEMAQVAFHDYLKGKLHGAIAGTNEEPNLNPETDTITKEQ